ncbi:hypothetical protein MKW98_000356 [Papaver atlanticum]|uniref:EXS domain-containing protein n=1 Tax=Papaver atlanticum TaxID=357466 RepID=A0AAD4S471_9MAGN|nr:hypothetical protein MKW98_000356 [Papaver atlanticum]
MRWFVEIGQTADHTRRHVVNDAVAIFHPPFLLSLMIFGWGAVIETFQRHGVEYHCAFRIVDEDRLRPFDIFQLGICILVSSIYSFMGYIILRGFMNQLYMSTVLGIALYVLIPVAFSLYYRVHHRSSFQSLRETLHAILCALFAREKPSFREVFLANTITSMAKVFSDSISAMFLLIHLLGVPHVDAIFGPKSYAGLIFTCLPFILRLFLSLRLGYSGKTIQYWNALKHLMTMSVTVLSSLKFLIDDEKTWLAQFFYPWVTLVSLNTIVSFVWDVKVDWRMTLTRWIPPRPILRSKIFTEEQRHGT